MIQLQVLRRNNKYLPPLRNVSVSGMELRVNVCLYDN